MPAQQSPLLSNEVAIRNYLQLMARYERLMEICQMYGTSAIRLAPTVTTEPEKRLFLQDAKACGNEGVIFRNRYGGYKEGRPNSGGDVQKLKFWHSASCIVAASRDPNKRSVGLRLHGKNGDDWFAIGNVDVPTNYPMPKVGDVAEIKYLYAYRGGSLYQPQWLGVRDDILPEACVMAQLHYKEESEQEDVPALVVVDTAAEAERAAHDTVKRLEQQVEPFPKPRSTKLVFGGNPRRV